MNLNWLYILNAISTALPAEVALLNAIVQSVHAQHQAATNPNTVPPAVPPTVPFVAPTEPAPPGSILVP